MDDAPLILTEMLLSCLYPHFTNEAFETEITQVTRPKSQNWWWSSLNYHQGHLTANQGHKAWYDI